MKRGYLSEYFDGVAAKRLSAVEADPRVSHQHEFQAIVPMLRFIGRASEPTPFPAKFVYLTDDDPDPIVDDDALTLYDSRRLKPHRTPEFRFYFKDNAVTQAMAEGDLLVIAKTRAGQLLVIIADDESSIASQLKWLFGLDDATLPGLARGRGTNSFSVRAELEGPHDRVAFASRLILETIGVEVEINDESSLDKIRAQFGDRWPETKDFSPFARALAPDLDAVEDPDGALIAWVDHEYVLYRTLERHLISERLNEGFGGETGVEDFLQFSLSVQNRRKSRSGSSLENHIEEILRANKVKYARGVRTEANSKPDFLFPGIAEYRDETFPAAQLHMLASKRSAKDRWRQILAEAERIQSKHLLTLEAAISQGQTDEMIRHNVQLVIPSSLHGSFNVSQRGALISVKQFVRMAQTAST